LSVILSPSHIINIEPAVNRTIDEIPKNENTNVDVLQMLAETKKINVFNKQVLVDNGLANKNDLIKILGRGDLTAKVEVEANAFSVSAVKAIEEKGGSATVV